MSCSRQLAAQIEGPLDVDMRLAKGMQLVDQPSRCSGMSWAGPQAVALTGRGRGRSASWGASSRPFNILSTSDTSIATYMWGPVPILSSVWLAHFAKHIRPSIHILCPCCLHSRVWSHNGTHKESRVRLNDPFEMPLQSFMCV